MFSQTLFVYGGGLECGSGKIHDAHLPTRHQYYNSRIHCNHDVDDGIVRYEDAPFSSAVVDYKGNRVD